MPHDPICAPAHDGVAAALAPLGLEPADALRVRWALQQPLGLILVAGPRQSGRSATLAALHAALAAAAGPSTAYAHACPQSARAAPDVLVLDPAPSAVELRRAAAAIPAGRRVLCAVTLERAAHVFGHFGARGIAPAALARDLLLVLAQQRVGRLCAHCRQPDRSAEVRSALAQAANSWLEGIALEPCAARPHGCARCAGTGHAGSALAYEMLLVDSGVRAMAEQGLVGLDMEQALFAEGRSLWDSGLRLVARGTCSLHGLRAALREPC